jgi:hypothetical protein
MNKLLLLGHLSLLFAASSVNAVASETGLKPLPNVMVFLENCLLHRQPYSHPSSTVQEAKMLLASECLCTYSRLSGRTEYDFNQFAAAAISCREEHKKNPKASILKYSQYIE